MKKALYCLMGILCIFLAALYIPVFYTLKAIDALQPGYFTGLQGDFASF